MDTLNQFKLVSAFAPAGDQPQAIEKLVKGLKKGLHKQTLLGVTGSGKTFSLAHTIAQFGRPTLILAPNKTLAAQLYGEMKSFFPHNAVEYFISYYDYYQPEAYVPSSDTYIEKDSSINAHIEQMRLSATRALLERKDVIIVASVSAIYGLGDPQLYLNMVLPLKVGDLIDSRTIAERLTALQYARNDIDFKRATYRVRGDLVDVFPAESAHAALRIHLFDEHIERLEFFDPLTGELFERVSHATIYPKTHYATPREQIVKAMDSIRIELKERLEVLLSLNKHVEHQRLDQRTRYDLEMLNELGYCNGIENYSRHLAGYAPGQPPPTLFDYLTRDALLVVDESHITIPQLGAMYEGDRSRKTTLVEYGFRLPSALDNRPLRFDEFEARAPQTIYVSATPGPYEIEHSQGIYEQVIRPTGLLDPEIEIRPADSQVDDVLGEIKKCTERGERVLITTLTKRMSEDLCDYLLNQDIKVRYLHSDIDSIERVEIIRDLRLGVFDVLIGINLLREGLDMPEVSLVAIFDADKEGFLRSERSLIQTMGRAARNSEGRVILYANKITQSMEKAMNVTLQRREKQKAYNLEHGIVPKTVTKPVLDIMEDVLSFRKTARDTKVEPISLEALKDIQHTTALLKSLEEKMYMHANNLEFEAAAEIRDQIERIQKLI